MKRNRWFAAPCAAVLLAASSLPELARAEARPDAPAAAGESAEGGWAFRGEVPETSVVAAPLEMSFFALAEPSFANVRVRAVKAGVAVPFAIRRRMVREPREKTLREPLAIADFSASGDAAALICNAPSRDGKYFAWSAFDIDTPLRDFEQAVQVFAEADGGAWQPIGEPQPIYDYSSHAPVRRTAIALKAPSSARRFRFVFSKAEDKVFSRSQYISESTTGAGERVEGRVKRYSVESRPFRVDAVMASRTVHEIVETKPASGAPLSIPAHQSQPVVEGVLLSLPVEAISFDVADRNFERTVKVESIDRNGDAQLLAETKISRTTLPGDNRESLKAAFREARPWQIRATFQNGDNPPLKLGDALAVYPVPYDICFIADPGEIYRLEFARKSGGKAPAYESKIEEYLRAGHDFAIWKLDAPPPALDIRAASPISIFLRKHGLVLFSVLLIAALGLLCLGAIRKAH